MQKGNGINITWTSSPAGTVNVAPSADRLQATITKIGTGDVTISVTISGACGSVTVNSATLRVGGYSTSDYPVSGSSSGSCGSYVYFNTNQLPFATSYTWFYPGNWSASGQGTYSLGLYIPSGISAGNYQVGVRVANACDAGGSYAVRNFYVTCNYFVQAYEMSPNPATNEVTIAPTDNASSATASNAKSSTTAITEVNIYDQQGLKLKQYKFANQKQVRLNVSSLKLGIYFVEIVAGSYRERQQLSIVK